MTKDPQMIRAALSHVPAEDREMWVRMAMAVKSALGDDGFDIWDDWSQRDSSYKRRDARSVWKSVRAGGRITVRSLFKVAQDYGFRFEKDQKPIPESPQARRARREKLAAQEREAAQRRRNVALQAQEILGRCELATHPYLAAKGFPGERGLIDDGWLVIPIRRIEDYRVVNVQRISQPGCQYVRDDGSIWTLDEMGRKFFLADGQARGGIYRLGRGADTWLCEGYATGLSIQAALRSMYRQAQVVICFSAGNLAFVSPQFKSRTYVMADNDPKKAGQLAAEKTGLPWVMPDTVGWDANDLHQNDSLDALKALMRRIS